jgi:2-dehydropantoate 2-reductase
MRKVAVVGAGAVGGYYGGMLARAGEPVVFIGRPAFVDAVRGAGLVLDTTSFREAVAVEADTNLAAARGAQLVLFCVKSGDTESVARELARVIEPGATVLSLQNGVDNVDRIRAVAGLNALPAVVYVAVSVPQPGTVKHVARGDLVLGPPGAETSDVAAFFEHAGVPCRISDNIQGELWAKLVANCALNAISALGRARYGRIAESGDARALMRGVVDEVFAVARAAGVTIPGMADAHAAFASAMSIARQMTEARSSTAQDIERGRRTEVDALNGYVARRAAELGVAAPLNHALWTLVKLLEQPSRWPPPARAGAGAEGG